MKKMTYKALILAAGLGTRLAPYTNVTPKPMFTLMGQPLLHYWIKRLAQTGCAEIFINTHHLHEQIETYIACNAWPLPVQTFYEPQILGTGGAIKNLAPYWQNDNLIIINSDIICDFDLTAFLRFHQTANNDVSLLLANCARFNTVAADSDGNITGFAGNSLPNGFTFTGIQAVTPALLDYIPPGVFYSSIQAYSAMIEDGRKVKGLLSAANWRDLGDVDSYRDAALTAGAAKAFDKIFNDNGKIAVSPLAGDGSDRVWRRLSTANNSMVAADHGLTPPANQGQTSEVEAFVNIGRHLNAKNLPVPQIYFYDTFAGLVYTEDAGDLSLQAYLQTTANERQALNMYTQIINALVQFSQQGVKGFNPRWAWQTATYNRELILQNECGYFTRRFLRKYLKLEINDLNLQPEFERLADEILRRALWGLMHRDFQSRNIFIKNGRPYFLDYQGARLGPLQYDLASLLYDPYAALDERMRNLLLEECCEHNTLKPWAARLKTGVYYCALSRSMQALGAYAFLSQIKGKPWFKQYMRPALNNLNNLLLNPLFINEFAALKAVTARALGKLEQLS